MKITNKKKLAAIALIPTLGVAAFAGSVFAADGTGTTSTGTTTFAGKIMDKSHYKGRSFGRMMKGLHNNTQFANNLASVLGLSAADVKAKLDAGETPNSIITGAGKTVADVQAQLKTLRLNNLKTKLASEMSAGTITQAQSDAIINRMTNKTHNGFGFRGHNGFKAPKTTNTATGTSTQ